VADRAESDFGVLTLATGSDAHKAAAMACSLRRCHPGISISLATPAHLVDFMKPFFDEVVPERTDIKGFEQKLYLDHYSPYERTLFLDADMYVFRDPIPVVEQWAGSAYTARGTYFTEGMSSFGLDRRRCLEKIGKDRLVVIGGAGHGYFERSRCGELFELSRSLAKDRTRFADNNWKFADEDVIGVAMTLLGLAPQEAEDLLCGPAAPGFRVIMDGPRCEALDSQGRVMQPRLLHFLAKQRALLYHRMIDDIPEVRRHFGRKHLLRAAFRDLYKGETPARKGLRRVRNWFRSPA